MPRTLSVVIPVHNEAGNIGRLIDEIHNTLQNVSPFEVLVVNDASDDDTASEVVACKNRYPGVRLLEHKQRSGQSAALWTGVRLARHSIVVTMDGDGQNDPIDIPNLLRRFESEQAADSQFAMVCGQRLNRKDTRIRKMSSVVANSVRRLVLKDKTPDSGCGLKVIDADVLRGLPVFNHMHRFLPALIQSQGYRLCSVPVNHRDREAGRSHYGINNRLWVGLADLFGVAWITRRAMRISIKEYS